MKKLTIFQFRQLSDKVRSACIIDKDLRLGQAYVDELKKMAPELYEHIHNTVCDLYIHSENMGTFFLAILDDHGVNELRYEMKYEDYERLFVRPDSV